MVEVVKEREVHRGVVVVARSKEDYEVECASVFAAVVQEVMEAKTEFFHSITPKTYLIDPGELNQTPLPSVSMLHLYAMREVERVLAKRKGVWTDTGFWIQTNSPTWADLLTGVSIEVCMIVVQQCQCYICTLMRICILHMAIDLTMDIAM